MMDAMGHIRSLTYGSSHKAPHGARGCEIMSSVENVKMLNMKHIESITFEKTFVYL